MPKLTNPRHEEFARLRVEGFSRRKAGLLAGFKSTGTGSWLGKKEDVLARIVALTDEIYWGETSDLAPVINELMRLARDAGGIGSAAGMVAARGLLAEAAKLKGRLGEPITGERSAAPRNPPLSNADWLAKHAPSR